MPQSEVPGTSSYKPCQTTAKLVEDQVAMQEGESSAKPSAPRTFSNNFSLEDLIQAKALLEEALNDWIKIMAHPTFKDRWEKVSMENRQTVLNLLGLGTTNLILAMAVTFLPRSVSISTDMLTAQIQQIQQIKQLLKLAAEEGKKDAPPPV